MKQRILTAVLALIVFIPFVVYGKWPFVLLVYLIATIGLMELLQMRTTKKYSLPAILAIGLLWIILYPLKTEVIPYMGLTKPDMMMLVVMLLLAYTVLVKNKFSFDEAGFVLIATIYIGLGFYYLIEARTEGFNYVFYALLVVWATDSGAYFFGRALGKRKLWPKISPKKTVEGAIGGIVTACIVAVIFQLVAPFPFSLLTIIGVTILASVFGQIGDLVESALKRHYNVKDSGNILPGHGGILDRFDSLLFVLPILYFVGFIH